MLEDEEVEKISFLDLPDRTSIHIHLSGNRGRIEVDVAEPERMKRDLEQRAYIDYSRNERP